MRKTSTENALLDAWETTLARLSTAPAVFAESGEAARTFAALEVESRELTRDFDRFAPGSVIALQIGNSVRWPALLLTLFRRELIPLPLGRHLGAVELELALGTCRVAALVSMENGALHVAPRAAAEPQWEEPVPHLLKLTSGTTSAPRAIRFRAAQLIADAEQICDTMGIGARDLNYGVVPFSHSYGFSNLLMPLLCRGVPLVASEDRMPRAILDGLARTRATVFPGMPVFFEKLAALDSAPALPKLRLCISAGAPLTCAASAAFTGRFGRKVHPFYGSSECGGISYDATDELVCEEGFVGTPMRGVEVSSAGDEAAPITVRSAAVGDGYFPTNDPEVLGGGCFRPGDLVRWTPRGMFLAGRSSEVINVAGRKLNPLEVEARLAELPGVKQAIVFGVPSVLRGEEPVACVAGEGLDPRRLLRLCQERLSPWQMPRDIWTVREIPCNERGKVNRRALAESYLARCRHGDPEP